MNKKDLIKKVIDRCNYGGKDPFFLYSFNTEIFDVDYADNNYPKIRITKDKMICFSAVNSGIEGWEIKITNEEYKSMLNAFIK